MKLIVLVSFFLWGCVMGGLGGVGGQGGNTLGQSFGTQAGSNQGNFSGTNYGDPFGATQTLMQPQQQPMINEQTAQQSLMPPDQQSAQAAEALTGQNFGSQSQSFGYGGPPASVGGSGGGASSFNTFLGKALPFANQAFNMAFPPAMVAKAGLTAVTSFVSDMLQGKDIPTAIRGGFLNGISSAIPLAGLVLGQLPRGEATGDTATMGQGIPGDLQGMANALMGGGMEQGMVPGVGALGASVQAGPGPQAAPSKAISPSPVAQNYYGMKRVNMPWAGWPQAQNREYGMKRV